MSRNGIMQSKSNSVPNAHAFYSTLMELLVKWPKFAAQRVTHFAHCWIVFGQKPKSQPEIDYDLSSNVRSLVSEIWTSSQPTGYINNSMKSNIFPTSIYSAIDFEDGNIFAWTRFHFNTAHFNVCISFSALFGNQSLDLIWKSRTFLVEIDVINDAIHSLHSRPHKIVHRFQPFGWVLMKQLTFVWEIC